MDHRHDVNHFQRTAVGVAISCMPKESSQLKDTELGASVFPFEYCPQCDRNYAGAPRHRKSHSN